MSYVVVGFINTSGNSVVGANPPGCPGSPTPACPGAPGCPGNPGFPGSPPIPGFPRVLPVPFIPGGPCPVTPGCPGVLYFFVAGGACRVAPRPPAHELSTFVADVPMLRGILDLVLFFMLISIIFSTITMFFSKKLIGEEVAAQVK